MKVDYTVVIDGKSFNQILSDIESRNNRTYKSFRDWLLFEKIPVDESELIDISLEQDKSVNVFVYGDNIYWISKYQVCFLNSNCRNMFEGLGFKNIDLYKLNNGIVEDVSNMFSNCLHLERIWLRGLCPDFIKLNSGIFLGLPSLIKVM